MFFNYLGIMLNEYIYFISNLLCILIFDSSRGDTDIYMYTYHLIMSHHAFAMKQPRRHVYCLHIWLILRYTMHIVQ